MENIVPLQTGFANLQADGLLPDAPPRRAPQGKSTTPSHEVRHFIQAVGTVFITTPGVKGQNMYAAHKGHVKTKDIKHIPPNSQLFY